MQATHWSPSIMIVDDTKFSSAVVKKILFDEGYSDIRIANSAAEALSGLKQRNADILVADWLMPGIDGLELTQLVRELNRRARCFTYVILLTAKEEAEDLRHAFTQGIDDFVGKTKLKTTLVPRVNAACRIAQVQNSLIQREIDLADKLRMLESECKFDVDTGTGNTKYLEMQFNRCLAQLQSRKGQVCLALCQVDNTQAAEALRYAEVKHAVLRQISERLKHTARPLDSIARVTDSVFALLLYSEQNEFSGEIIHRRIHHRLFNQPYETALGRLPLDGKIETVIINSDDISNLDATTIIKLTLRRLYGESTARASSHNPKINESA